MKLATVITQRGGWELRVPASGLAPLLLLEALADYQGPVNIQKGEAHKPGTVTDEIGGLPYFIVTLPGVGVNVDPYSTARNYINANL